MGLKGHNQGQKWAVLITQANTIHEFQTLILQQLNTCVLVLDQSYYKRNNFKMQKKVSYFSQPQL